jgi:hypothetical protein
MSNVTQVINTIEMFGLCGSGKTTVQSDCNIEKIVNIHNPISISAIYTYVFTIYIAIKMFVISPVNLLRFLYDHQSRRLLLKLGLRVGGIFKRRNIYRCNEIFLRDSGVLMPFVSAIIEESWDWRKSYVLLFFAVLPVPKKAVFVYVKPSVAYARYIGRNKNKDVSQDFFYSANEFCQFLCTLLESRGVEMIKVDNNVAVKCSFLNNKLKARQGY